MMQKIILIWFIVFSFIMFSLAHQNDFIRDYFIYKKVKGVVGVSCRNTTDDFHLLKAFNALKIYSIIKKPGTHLDIHGLLSGNYSILGIFLDLHCPEEMITTIFTESSKYRMYDYLYNWLIMGTTLNTTTTILNDTAYSTITDVVISVPNNQDYDLYDVFNHCKYRGGLLNITKFGLWSAQNGLHVTLNEPKLLRRNNLHGMRLRMSGAIQYRPTTMRLEDYMHDINTRSLDSMHKFAYAMIIHIADMFNFSVHAMEITWWDKASLHGAMFDILRTNDVEFGSNPRAMVSERGDYASLVDAVWPVRPCFLLLSRPSTKIRLDVFMKPFSNGVWQLTILFLGICMLVIFWTIKFEQHCSKLDQIAGAIVLTIGIISQQGASYFPNRMAARIAVLVAALFSWILYNYYSCCIVSVRLSDPFDKIEDSVAVLSNSNIRIGAESVPYLNYIIQKFTSTYFRKKRWDPLPDSEKYLPLVEGIKQVAEGTLAYHTDPNTAYPYIEQIFEPNQICELAEIHLLKQSVMGLFVSHNGQFREITKIGLLRFLTAGLKDRQIKYWSSRKPLCQKDSLSTRGITINEIAPAFILLLMGIIFSILICLVENFTFNRSRRITKSLRMEIIPKSKKNKSGFRLIDLKNLRPVIVYLKLRRNF